MRGRTTSWLLALLATGCARGPDGPHVVLISLDTTRADHLGCYGNERVATPNLDRIAAEGILFRDATSTAPTTLASHTAIFTGKYPRSHGVVRNGFMVHEENVMLTEVLADAGYRTAGFLASFALHSLFDFDQGFEYFDETFDIELDGQRYDQNQRRAEQVTDAVLRFVDGAGDEPLFLFAHYFDPHAPYDPPAPYDAMYTRPDGPRAADLVDLGEAVAAQQERLIGRELDGMFAQGLPRELLEAADGVSLQADEDLAALYAGEVTYMDFHLGRLFDGLRERGILDDALIVITADHGETFTEHGDFWNHGLCVYETTIDVPLIVRLPGGQHGGTVVEDAVSTIDVVPTVLDRLGLEPPEGLDGRSLAAHLSGAAVAEDGARPLFAEATQPAAPAIERGPAWGNESKAKTVREGPWKYVTTPYLGFEELYHLERDPAERHNLLAGAAPDSEALEARARLRGRLAAWRAGHRPLPSTFNPEQTREAMRRLSAIGYGSVPEDEDG